MNKKLLIAFIALAMVILAACQAAAPATPTPAPTTAPTSATTSAVVLALTGAKESKSLTLDDLKKLPATEGQAGLKSSTGKIFPPARYKGILLTDLLKEVGGADSSMGVQVEAKDGYAMTYSYDQISTGAFITYDPATGDETKNAGKLQVLIAYEIDGKPLNVDQDGALRLVVISDKPNQVTDGHWSVKFITKIATKPLSADWTLDLQGAITDKVDRGSFESCSTSKCHQASWKDEKTQNWVGTPLYYLVGRVDDEIKHDNGSFNKKLAEQGYTIEIVAKDGYSVKLDSKQVENDKSIIVAYQMNDNALLDKDFPLKLVGPNLTKKDMVGGIAKIILHLGMMSTSTPAPTATPEVAAATATPESSANSAAVLEIKGKVAKAQAWTLDDLKKMEQVKENVEYPKKGKQDVAGVRINALLDLATLDPSAASLVLTASDGFTSETKLDVVRACNSCLVIFNNTGGVDSVMPNLASNLWARDLVKIEVK
jgi:DMSO/TMAO reductase YedYZ molybdopterin-dependent catalytic subunit